MTLPVQSEPRPEPPSGPKLSDLAGMGGASAFGKALARDFLDLYAGRIAWSEVDPGCVLHGPPGTGKTTFAKALAAELRLPLVATTYADWQGTDAGYLSNTINAMREVFAQATTWAPCILFIDELDSVPARGGGGQNAFYANPVTNALLKCFDEIRPVKGVVVVGACNHPDLLDPALVRSGRLDRMIPITLPTVEELPAIIRFHLRNDAATVGDLSSVAVMRTGSSGADIEKTVREARRLARGCRRALARSDLITAIEAAIPQLSPEDRKRVAIHEAGHAVAALRLRLSDSISFSVVPNKGSLGHITAATKARIVTATGIDNLLTVLLAGRAAEDVMLKEASGGAGGGPNSDLARATFIACEAVANLGLSKYGSVLWLGTNRGEDLRMYPAHVIAEADEMLSQALARAKDLVLAECAFVGRVADALISRNALSHRALLAIDLIGRPRPPIPRRHPLEGLMSPLVLRSVPPRPPHPPLMKK